MAITLGRLHPCASGRGRAARDGKVLLGEHYEEGIAYPGARPSLLIGADELEDSERLCELVRVTAAALPPAKPKKPKRSRASAH